MKNQFKTKLVGVIALVLLAVMCLSSCSNSDVQEQIDGIKTDVESVKTSVQKATDDLTAAINAGDKDVSDKVAALETAVKDAATAKDLADAKKALEDADAALKTALDDKASKADVEAVKTAIAAVEAAQKALDEKLGGKIDKDPYVAATEDAIAAIKTVESSYATIVAGYEKGDYAKSEMDKLTASYYEAKTRLYRALSKDDVKAAADAFATAVKNTLGIVESFKIELQTWIDKLAELSINDAEGVKATDKAYTDWAADNADKVTEDLKKVADKFYEKKVDDKTVNGPVERIKELEAAKEAAKTINEAIKALEVTADPSTKAAIDAIKADIAEWCKTYNIVSDATATNYVEANYKMVDLDGLAKAEADYKLAVEGVDAIVKKFVEAVKAIGGEDNINLKSGDAFTAAFNAYEEIAHLYNIESINDIKLSDGTTLRKHRGDYDNLLNYYNELKAAEKVVKDNVAALEKVEDDTKTPYYTKDEATFKAEVADVVETTRALLDKYFLVGGKVKADTIDEALYTSFVELELLPKKYETITGLMTVEEYLALDKSSDISTDKDPVLVIMFNTAYDEQVAMIKSVTTAAVAAQKDIFKNLSNMEHEYDTAKAEYIAEANAIARIDGNYEDWADKAKVEITADKFTAWTGAGVPEGFKLNASFAVDDEYLYVYLKASTGVNLYQVALVSDNTVKSDAAQAWYAITKDGARLDSSLSNANPDAKAYLSDNGEGEIRIPIANIYGADYELPLDTRVLIIAQVGDANGDINMGTFADGKINWDDRTNDGCLLALKADGTYALTLPSFEAGEDDGEGDGEDDGENETPIVDTVPTNALTEGTYTGENMWAEPCNPEWNIASFGQKFTVAEGFKVGTFTTGPLLGQAADYKITIYQWKGNYNDTVDAANAKILYSEEFNNGEENGAWTKEFTDIELSDSIYWEVKIVDSSSAFSYFIATSSESKGTVATFVEGELVGRDSQSNIVIVAK